MSPSGKAPAESSGASSERPLGDDQDARPSPASTSLRELFQRTKSNSDALRDPFKDDANDLDQDHFIVAKLSLPAASEKDNLTAVSAPLTLPESSSPSRTRASSRSSSPSHLAGQRPSFRTRVVRGRRDRANSRSRIFKPQSIPAQGSNSSPRATLSTSPEYIAKEITKEEEGNSPEYSYHSSPAQQTLDKATAKSWREKFLATEAKEKLLAKTPIECHNHASSLPQTCQYFISAHLLHLSWALMLYNNTVDVLLRLHDLLLFAIIITVIHQRHAAYSPQRLVVIAVRRG